MSDLFPNIDQILRDSWEYYKRTRIEKNGRTLCDDDEEDLLDSDGDAYENVTVSEGQAYSLLRAVWIDDYATFERVWSWTQANLQRMHIREVYDINKEVWVPMPAEKRDYLFAWRYVPTLGGREGGIIIEKLSGTLGQEEIVDRSGIEAASDDIEIAAALYFAHLRGWKPSGGGNYMTEAKNILQSAWEKYVVSLGGKYYYFAGDQFTTKGEINPSYFRPAYFAQIFPLIDPEHPWEKVAETSYEIIERSGKVTLYDKANHPIPGKVNLPPNFLDVGYSGQWVGDVFQPDLIESDAFKERDGEAFGWDAFRTLWAVAQDYAWFENPTAQRYLTNEDFGPHAFLKAELDHTGRIWSCYQRNGKMIFSLRCPNELPGPYGAYLPYFYFGNDPEAAGTIYARLTSSRFYTSGGEYKGMFGGGEYYEQNWAWFGLALVNGFDLLPKIKEEIRKAQVQKAALPKPKEVDVRENLPKLPKGVEVDRSLGSKYGVEGRAQLKRDWMEKLIDNKKLKTSQLEEIVQVIFQAPPNLALTIKEYEESRFFSTFAKIKEIDEKYNFRFFGYFTDLREFWNNAVIILSLLTQKYAETNNKKGIQKAVEYCIEFRKKIADQERVDRITGEAMTPHLHTQASLDLIQAELMSQVKDQDESFYQEGITLALEGLRKAFAINPKQAAPDYFLAAKALLIIGDLYMKLNEVTQDDNYLDQASAFYTAVAQLDQSQNQGLEIHFPELNLDFRAEVSDIEQALARNQALGHLAAEDLEKARKGIFHYMKGVALLKKVGIFVQRLKEKPLAEIFEQLETCQVALSELEAGKVEKGKPDFFIELGKLLKADLFLLLADRLNYEIWPDLVAVQSREELQNRQAKAWTDTQNAALRLHRLLATNSFTEMSFSLGKGDLAGAWRGFKEFVSNAVETFSRPTTLELNNLLLAEAEEQYQKTPAEFEYLRAWATIKKTEVSIRRGVYITHEFSYLLPFFMEGEIFSENIQDGEYFGVQLNHLKATMLISHNHAGDLPKAQHLIDKILESVTTSKKLKPPSKTYFDLHSELKRADIFIKEGQFWMRLRNFHPATVAFARAEAILRKGLTKIPSLQPYAKLLSWKEHALRAEIYHGLAIIYFLTNKGGLNYAEQALEECYKSGTTYNVTRRVEDLVADFPELDRRDKELKERYGVFK